MNYAFLVLSFLFLLSGCKNPLGGVDSLSSIDDGYNFLLTTPDQTQILSSDAGNGEVTLSLSESNRASSYVVRYGLSSGFYTNEVTCYSSTCRITGLINLNNYYIVAHAENAKGRSLPSSEIQLAPTTQPGTPTNLEISGRSDGIFLNWTVSPRAITYKVYRTLISGDYSGATIFPVSSNSFSDSSATSGLIYYYKVTALNGAEESASTNELQAQVLAAPTSLVVTSGANSVSLSWQSVPGASSYSIYRSVSSGSEGSPITQGVVGTSFSDSTGDRGVVYYYSVRAHSLHSRSDSSLQQNGSKLPVLNFTSTSSSVVEGNSVTVGISLSAVSQSDVTVGLSYAGSALGARYSGPSTVTVPAGQLGVNFVVSINENVTEEDVQNIQITLQALSLGIAGAQSLHSVSIEDNDYPTISVRAVTINEGSTGLMYVDLNRASTRAVNFNYATSNGTAVSGVNYVSVSGTGTFLPGETTKQIVISTMTDSNSLSSSATKQFSLNLSSVTNVQESSVFTSNITIDKPRVYFPLQTNLFAARSPSAIAVSYSRVDGGNYIATVVDNDGVVRYARSGEARFEGARRVENLIAISENLASSSQWFKSASTTIIEQTSSGGPGGRGYTRIEFDGQAYMGLLSSLLTGKIRPNRNYQLSAYIRTSPTNTGGNNILLSQEGGACEEAKGATCGYHLRTVDGTWKRYSIKFKTDSDGGTFWPLLYQFSVYYSGKSVFDISSVQLEEVSGAANEAPSEYVSCGVLAAPFHGAGVDCVKYFNTKNENTYSTSTGLVTENTGIEFPSAQNYFSTTDLTRSFWTKSESTIALASNQVSPIGGGNVYKLSESTSFTQHMIYNISSGMPSDKYFTYSTYAKAGENSLLSMHLYGHSGAIWMYRGAVFNLNSGECLKTNPITNGVSVPVHNCTIEEVGNGWYRLSVTANTPTYAYSSFHVELKLRRTYSADNDENYAGDVSRGVYLWGPQLEEGLSPGRLTPTSGASRTNSVRGYLSENSSYNLINSSRDLFDFQHKNASEVAITAPDGHLISTQFTLDTAAGPRIYIENSVEGNKTYTGSVYARLVGGSSITHAQVLIKDNGTDTIRGEGCLQALSTDRWVRLQATGTTAGSTTGVRFEVRANAGGASAKILLWGAQLEPFGGVSSYIPRDVTSYSRGKDEMTLPSNEVVFVQGAVFAEYLQRSSPGLVGTRNYLLMKADSGTQRWALRTADPDGNLPHFVIGNGSVVSTLRAVNSGVPKNEFTRIGFSYNTDSAVFKFQDNIVQSSTGYSMDSTSTISIGSSTHNYNNILIRNLEFSNRSLGSKELVKSGF